MLRLSFSPRSASSARLISLALLAVVALGATAACGGADPVRAPEAAGQSSILAPLDAAAAQAARDAVIAFLSDKPWGFFGATCDRWVDIDYDFSAGLSGISDDGDTVVVFTRLPSRAVGPSTLTFRISASGDVSGDNVLERSGVAEGCDKW